MQEEQFCQIILILDQWFRRRCHLKYFYMGSGGPCARWIRTIICNFGRGHYWKPSCEVILNLD